MSERRGAVRRQDATLPAEPQADRSHQTEGCCQLCGQEIPKGASAVLKRGAVTLRYRPIEVRWRGLTVPLSKHEALFFERFMRRGRATLATVDAWLKELQWRDGYRATALFNIRQKFASLGAADPLHRCNDGLVFYAEADEYGSTQVLIGLRDTLEAAAVGPPGAPAAYAKADMPGGSHRKPA